MGVGGPFSRTIVASFLQHYIYDGNRLSVKLYYSVFWYECYKYITLAFWTASKFKSDISILRCSIIFSEPYNFPADHGIGGFGRRSHGEYWIEVKDLIWRCIFQMQRR